jgi:hypothetical protein
VIDARSNSVSAVEMMSSCRWSRSSLGHRSILPDGGFTGVGKEWTG